MKNGELAARFCEAIKKLSDNEDNLITFELYLSAHFDKWMEKYANDPDGLTSEVELFAGIE